MDPYEVADLAISAATRLDVIYGLYISVHLAIFAGIIYVDRPLRLYEKLGTGFLYTFFMIVSFRQMARESDRYDAINREAAQLAADPCCSASPVIQHMANDFVSGRFELASEALFLVHAIFYAMVVLAITFDRRLRSRSTC